MCGQQENVQTGGGNLKSDQAFTRRGSWRPSRAAPRPHSTVAHVADFKPSPLLKPLRPPIPDRVSPVAAVGERSRGAGWISLSPLASGRRSGPSGGLGGASGGVPKGFGFAERVGLRTGWAPVVLRRLPASASFASAAFAAAAASSRRQWPAAAGGVLAGGELLVLDNGAGVAWAPLLEAASFGAPASD